MTRRVASTVAMVILGILAVTEARRGWEFAAKGIQREMVDMTASFSINGRTVTLAKAPTRNSFYIHSSSDSGLPTLEPCQVVKCHMTLVVALDASGSVRRSNFQKELTFTQKLLEIMALKADENDIKICVGVLTYSSEVNVIANPCCENSVCRIVEELEDVHYDSRSTDTHGALKVARQMLQSTASYRKVLLLITDGQSTTGSPVPFAQQMRNDDGVSIVTLGVGSSIRRSELRGISGSTSDVLLIHTFDDFHDLANQIISSNSVGSSLTVTFEEFCRDDDSTFAETCIPGEGCTWGKWSACESDGERCTMIQPCVLEDGSYVKSRVKECTCGTSTEATPSSSIPTESSGDDDDDDDDDDGFRWEWELEKDFTFGNWKPEGTDWASRFGSGKFPYGRRGPDRV